MSWRDLDSFHRADPRRAGSHESRFGVWDGDGHSLRATWLEQTGELVAVTLGGQAIGRVRALALVPRLGHPDPRRAD